MSTSLDLAASGSFDGTGNIRTIKEGQYIRTLNGQTGIEHVIITHLWLSDRDGVIAAEEKDSYTTNGHEKGLFPCLFTNSFGSREEFVAFENSNGDVTVTRVLSLMPILEFPFHSPVENS